MPKKIEMLATDLASRGLDFAHATHVINYDFPKYTEAYTHRSGRTARMGRKGVALTLFSRSDLRILKAIIEINSIKPIWEGQKPDLTDLPKFKKRKQFYRGRGKGRRR
jgi:ATP-dependent RNA helicase DeaD